LGRAQVRRSPFHLSNRTLAGNLSVLHSAGSRRASQCPSDTRDERNNLRLLQQPGEDESRCRVALGKDIDSGTEKSLISKNEAA